MTGPLSFYVTKGDRIIMDERNCSEIAYGERVKQMKSSGPVYVSICPNIFAYGARTAGPIGTGGYYFDAPERR